MEGEREQDLEDVAQQKPGRLFTCNSNSDYAKLLGRLSTFLLQKLLFPGLQIVVYFFKALVRFNFFLLFYRRNCTHSLFRNSFLPHNLLVLLRKLGSALLWGNFPRTF